MIVKRVLFRFRDDSNGATAIEYGLIAALMAVAIIACLTAFGPQMRQGFTWMGGQMAQPADVTSN